ncbi:hypothetical protein A3K93_06670 [Acinetobacter sp. NCu2D-2]|uniref:TetR/AcrR family transcriptional regulator n=1 Tax=Acinetobacter sp. NCu2D-2 TaxID=1608473 RepID=UPI0007CE0C47|nr:TetR/AcrR family transcriptional regulator [Acinetobacter sp. NCu2D-2]ANF81904.1 hypothetical protein A3K93_06670 [Acinetobacter sp. NCu2D-2]
MPKLGRPIVMTVDERRNTIFNSAEKLFGEKGFEHVTMSEIAQAAGMSKKTLYVHFSDKRELLKSLVTSSYIWSTDAFSQESLEPVAALTQCLKMIANHVLSERHIKLCRLAIAEQVGIEGLADTFYEMGISASRNHLIEMISNIPVESKVLKLPDESIADMLFGGCISKSFIDSLFAHKGVDLQEIYIQIDRAIDALFI